jgi:hypothetical protein
MSAPGEVQASESPSRLWWAVCGGLCAAILAYGGLGYKEPSGNLAYQFGYNLPIAIFIGGGLHLAFRKRESSRTGWMGFALVFASLITASLIANQMMKSDVRDAAAHLEQSIAAVQAAASAGTATPPPMPITNSGSSDGAKMGVIIKTMVNRMLALRREYELELDAIGWGKILDGQRLKTDVTFAESRTILKQANEIVLRYKSKNADLFSTIRQDIELSELSSSSKQSMLTGFDRTSEQGKAEAMEVWRLEQQALDEIGKIIALLSARRSAWEVQDGQVMFQSQEDLDMFNAYLAKVQAVIAKQEQIQAASLQRSKDAFEKITR